MNSIIDQKRQDEEFNNYESLWLTDEYQIESTSFFEMIYFDVPKSDFENIGKENIDKIRNGGILVDFHPVGIVRLINYERSNVPSMIHCQAQKIN